MRSSAAKKIVEAAPAPSPSPVKKRVVVGKTSASDGAPAKPALSVVVSGRAESNKMALQFEALNGLPYPVFLCDQKWEIIYANEAAIESFQEMEIGLRSAGDHWRSVNSQNLLGSNATFFFADEPFEIKKALDPRSHPYRKTVQVGQYRCEMKVDAVRNAQGELLGFGMYWSNATERLQEEETYKEQVKLIADRMEFLRQACSTDLATAMDALARGNLDFTIEPRTPLLDIPKQPDLAYMAETFNGLRNQTVKSVEAYMAARATIANLTTQVGEGSADLLKAMKSLAAGDLTYELSTKTTSSELNANSAGVFGAMMLQNSASIEAYRSARESLADLIAKALVTSDTIVEGSTEVMNGNDDLAQRTEEQAASLEETASSMEQMTATVKQNADNAKQADRLAGQARETAEKGGLVVGNAVATMEEINKASRRIADIISVIDEIAFQTNLLALNAAVEAARVGEQGRGFAVVAAEVRNLAGRSATAAKEIKGLVQDSVQKVQEGSSLVNQSGAQLGEIMTSVKKVADIISEIAAAALEQAAGIEQVNKAITQMDQITQQNAALVEEASASSQTMSQQAGDLQTLVGQFKVDGALLAQVRDRLHVEEGGGKSRQVQAFSRNDRPSSRSAQRAPMPKSRRLAVATDEFEEF